MQATDTIAARPTPYDEVASSKSARLLGELNELTRWHSEFCEPYRRILRAACGGRTGFNTLEELPVLPVRLFKSIDLASVPASEIISTMVSSGTTSQQPSRIFLDRGTATAQTRALIPIMRSFLGPKRLPMLIVDSSSSVGSREMYSARTAAVLGFSQIGCDHTYLLNESMEWVADRMETFLERHRGETILLFGFTFIVWQHLYKASLNRRKVDLTNSILIHGGGWKKLKDQQVSNEEFSRRLQEQLGIRRIYNYYGLVEQTGSIFVACDQGHFHAPAYADVLVREPETLVPLPFGQSGLLQLVSNIPRSYPGHVVLTEDLGVVLGEDDCPCNRKGKYFRVQGQLPQAELRGCSDTHQEGMQ